MGASTNCHSKLVNPKTIGKATKNAKRSWEEYAATTSCCFLVARSYSFASKGAACSRFFHACPTSAWALWISGNAVLIPFTLEMKGKRQTQTTTTLKIIQVFFKVTSYQVLFDFTSATCGSFMSNMAYMTIVVKPNKKSAFLLFLFQKSYD